LARILRRRVSRPGPAVKRRKRLESMVNDREFGGSGQRSPRKRGHRRNVWVEAPHLFAVPCCSSCCLARLLPEGSSQKRAVTLAGMITMRQVQAT